MDDLSFCIGIIGNIISAMVFLSPIGTFWRIIKKRSTEDFESLPYICILLNSSLWTYYGIIKPGSYLVATVNGFGVLVQLVYLFIFLTYAPRKAKVRTAMLVAILNVGFLGAAMAATWFALQGETRIKALGFVCTVLNIVAYGSPLAAMKTVVTTKSVEYMPFFLSFTLFLNGGIWALYAFLVHDYFLLVPNGIGFLLGTSQLVIYAIYRNAKPLIRVSAGLEEGQYSHSHSHSHREPLITLAN